MTNRSFVRVLQVDDFAPWRRFILAKLRQDHSVCVVGTASGSIEAVLKATELQPDLILLDIGLPTINGIVAARQIRAVAPQAKILFVSQALDIDVVRIALFEGGDGYVVKSDADRDLFIAVEAVMRGKKFLSRSVTLASLSETP